MSFIPFMESRNRIAKLVVACTATLLAAAPALAQDLIVKKNTFTLPEYTTVAGKTLKNVKVGWEAYGTLNADKTNAILVNHYFSGASHAAGKYAPTDAAPGYWDAIIGPGKAIDTNKYYVISSDTLVNLNVGDPNVVTTGPASVDPATGKPYGMNFPVVSIGDFVKVQKALIDDLGIKHLRAVMGASMGGLQTYEWAASYPDMMDKIMPVISAADPGPWLIGWLNIWASPILIDPNWNNGDYYGKTPPVEGLKTALKIVSLQAADSPWADQKFGKSWATEGQNPAQNFDAKFKIEAALDAGAAARAKIADANAFLYLVKANQIFMPGAAAGVKNADEGMARIKAKTLILYAQDDHVFLNKWIKDTAAAISKNGASVETSEIPGPTGHLNGVALLSPLSAKISDFLAK